MAAAENLEAPNGHASNIYNPPVGEDFLATVLTDPERPSLGRFLSLYRVPTTTAEFLTVFDRAGHPRFRGLRLPGRGVLTGQSEAPLPSRGAGLNRQDRVEDAVLVVERRHRRGPLEPRRQGIAKPKRHAPKSQI